MKIFVKNHWARDRFEIAANEQRIYFLVKDPGTGIWERLRKDFISLKTTSDVEDYIYYALYRTQTEKARALFFYQTYNNHRAAVNFIQEMELCL